MKNWTNFFFLPEKMHHFRCRFQQIFIKKIGEKVNKFSRDLKKKLVFWNMNKMYSKRKRRIDFKNQGNYSLQKKKKKWNLFGKHYFKERGTFLSILLWWIFFKPSVVTIKIFLRCTFAIFNRFGFFMKLKLPKKTIQSKLSFLNCTTYSNSSRYVFLLYVQSFFDFEI